MCACMNGKAWNCYSVAGPRHNLCIATIVVIGGPVEDFSPL